MINIIDIKMEVYFQNTDFSTTKKIIDYGRFLTKETETLYISFKNNDDCMISKDDYGRKFIVTCKKEHGEKEQGKKVEFEKTFFTKVNDIEEIYGEKTVRFINMTNLELKPIDGFEQCKGITFRDNSFSIECTNEKWKLNKE